MTAVNRTITVPKVVIPEELPAGSVVIARNGMPWARGGGMESWVRPDTGRSGFGPVTLPWSTLVQSEGPLTVVWEPGAQPEQDGHDDALAAKKAELTAAKAVAEASQDVHLATRELDLARRRLFTAREAQREAARR